MPAAPHVVTCASWLRSGVVEAPTATQTACIKNSKRTAPEPDEIADASKRGSAAAKRRRTSQNPQVRSVVSSRTGKKDELQCTTASVAAGGGFHRLRVTHANKPHRSYITGALRDPTACQKRKLIVEISANMSKSHQTLSKQIAREVEARQLTKEAALQLRSQLLVKAL